MADIWDITVPNDPVDIWLLESERQLVDQDVIDELRLPTVVYSGAYKSGTMQKFVTSGTRRTYERLAPVKSNLTREGNYRRGQLQTMILKGTIAWEILPD